MDIPVKGKPKHVEDEAAHTEEGDSEQSASTPVNPWTAVRAHYAQVQIILSWSSRVFQRHAALTRQLPHRDDESSAEEQ